MLLFSLFYLQWENINFLYKTLHKAECYTQFDGDGSILLLISMKLI